MTIPLKLHVGTLIWHVAIVLIGRWLTGSWWSILIVALATTEITWKEKA